MSEDLRAAILQEALHEAPFSGFSDAMLRIAATRAGATPAQIAMFFPDGAASLVTLFSHWADAHIETRLAQERPDRIRDRITKAVRVRLEALAPHKEAARRAASFLALPMHAPLATTLLFESVDAMWRAAGDNSSDFNYYTKRALLAGVYASTLVYWFSDDSDDSEKTWAFLDKRIDDVMQIQKMRGELEKVVSQLPDPLGVLAALRAAGPR